jgi:dolichol-phosphate mannosyltransferase
MSLELIAVMPVYNEQASIARVVHEWMAELAGATRSFTLLVCDDGSTDQTPAILDQLRAQYGPGLTVLRHPNRGHGQTCLAGYRLALSRGASFILQIDSDGQCDPGYFRQFWSLRDRFDAVYGYRRRRDDGVSRLLASRVLRLSLRLCAGADCIDANVPYRLLRVAALEPELSMIGPEFDLANIALAVLLRRKMVRETFVPIRFRARFGGEPKVRLTRFAAKAWKLHGQLRRLRPDTAPGTATRRKAA